MDVLTSALGGLDRAQEKFDLAAGKLASNTLPSSGGGPTDIVDLSEAAVSLVTARNDFAANLQAVKTADEMQRDTINLLA